MMTPRCKRLPSNVSLNLPSDLLGVIRQHFYKPLLLPRRVFREIRIKEESYKYSVSKFKM